MLQRAAIEQLQPQCGDDARAAQWLIFVLCVVSLPPSDLFLFIDSLSDLATLTFDSRTSSYVPHNKQWIKVPFFTLC